jgi:SRR1
MENVSGITNAVIFGLGNLDDETDRQPSRAALQLALFLSLVAVICQTGDSKPVDKRVSHMDDEKQLRQCLDALHLPCYAQDPAFTRTDEAILQDVNIEVLSGSKGADMISEHSLVFAPFVDVTVLMPEILQGKSPAVYVGVDFNIVDDTIGNDAEVYAEQYA